jgi:hypothetical protein
MMPPRICDDDFGICPVIHHWSLDSCCHVVRSCQLYQCPSYGALPIVLDLEREWECSLEVTLGMLGVRVTLVTLAVSSL